MWSSPTLGTTPALSALIRAVEIRLGIFDEVAIRVTQFTVNTYI
jgi:hypothetical protein